MTLSWQSFHDGTLGTTGGLIAGACAAAAGFLLVSLVLRPLVRALSAQELDKVAQGRRRRARFAGHVASVAFGLWAGLTGALPPAARAASLPRQVALFV